MTTYYKATFSDGTTIRRSTVSRTYSHAWLVKCLSVATGYRWTESGFSRDAQRARQAMSSAAGMRSTFAETASAIEITRKEYLELA